MNEINRVLSKAAWRMGMTNFLKGLVVTLAALLAAAIVLRVVEQIFGFTVAQASIGPRPEGARAEIVSGVMWEMVGYGAAGAAVLGGVVWAMVRRPQRLAVARRVDEGANLKESLSTALCVAKQDDPWSRATVESATRTARGVNVAAAVPIQPPRFWPVVVALGLSLGIVWVALPKLDVMGWFATAEAQKKKEVEIANAKRDVEEVKKKIEELTAKIPDMEKEKAAETPPADKPEPKTAEEIRKAMVAQLAKKAEQLEDLKDSAKSQKLEAMQAQLKQLKQPGQETSELAKALAKADFKSAKAELEKVKDKLAASDSKLSPEEKEKLAAQLEKMAEQLKEMANNQEAMEKALKEAGIPKEALASKEALQKAIQKSENLSKEQKEALQKMCEGGMDCKNGMAAMAQAMDKMSKAGKSNDGQQAEQGANGMTQQLSEMEDLQQEMQMTEAAMSECKNAMQAMGKDGNCDGMGECNGNGNGNGEGKGNGTKPWSSGWNQAMGGGRGGAGLGQGGRPGEAKADFSKEKKMDAKVKGDGPIISTKLVEGESVRGESKAEFAKVVAAGEQNATEAIENNVIPREYHDAIKGYFGRLKGKTGNGSPAGGDAEKKKDEPAAAPAEDAGGKGK